MQKIKVKCVECDNKYEFLQRWLTKNDPKKFICRNCKIKKTTQSNKFKEESRNRSIELLSDDAVKSKMSLIATINNSKNADKISKSLRKFYQNSKNKSENSDRITKLWKSKNYRKKISDKIKGKWLEDDYRIKVLTSKDRKEVNTKFSTKDHNELKKKLIASNIKFEENFFISIYQFNFLINDEILVDLEADNDKQYKYQSDYLK
jgi:hypothetical protein